MNEVEVLIVEDNPHDLEMTLRALRKSNFANRVATVTDGEQALDFLFGRGEYEGRDINEHPRVILLDLKLPKIDGAEVLRIIKSDPQTRSIPVVIITSSAEERDRVMTYDLGANSYVVKPIEFDAFARTIADLGFYWLAVNQPPHS
jgi:two-component system, response regulator